jgi:fumarate hydratase class II
MFRERCLEGIEVTEAGRRMVHHNPILVTALNRAIGYEQAAALARESAASGRTVRELAKERTDLSQSQLDDLLDPVRMCGDRGRRRRPS